jgi:hypothetical protein
MILCSAFYLNYEEAKNPRYEGLSEASEKDSLKELHTKKRARIARIGSLLILRFFVVQISFKDLTTAENFRTRRRC